MIHHHKLFINLNLNWIMVIDQTMELNKKLYVQILSLIYLSNEQFLKLIFHLFFW
jgi:hypothetical protein